MIRTEVQHPLTCKIKYPSKDGSVIEANFITLHAPTTRNLGKVSPLKQLLMRAIREEGEKFSPEEIQALQVKKEDCVTSPEKEDSDINEGDMLMAMISSSATIDLTAFLNTFISVLKTSDLAQIDGEIQLKDSFVDQLPISELEGLAGAYLSNFIAPSV